MTGPGNGRRRREIEADIEREFHFHLAELTAELERDGLSPADAEAEARRRFGDLAHYRERCRREAPEERTQRLVRLAVGLTLAAVLSMTWWVGWGRARGNPLHEELMLHLAYGVPLALAAGVRIPFSRTWLRRICLFLAGAVCLWMSIILGTHMGYGTWQRMPDPPDEAFADGADLMLSVLAGWLPGLVLVFGTAVVTALFRFALRRLLRAP